MNTLNIKIHFFDNEIELLSNFFGTVHSYGPDFIEGWNSSAFDLEYIITRIGNLGYDPADIMCDQSWEIKVVKNYAKDVEYGQPAGTIVDKKALIEWIKKKGLADTYTRSGNRRSRGSRFKVKIETIAFFVQRSIRAKGVKARPFLFPAFRKYESKVINIINNAINRVI